MLKIVVFKKNELVRTSRMKVESLVEVLIHLNKIIFKNSLQQKNKVMIL